MKVKRVLIMLVNLSLLASCGGGGSGGQSVQPTSTETKAVAGASVAQVSNATGNAVNEAIQNTIGSYSISAMTAKDVSKTVSLTRNISYQYQCALAGLVLVTGTLYLNCVFHSTDSCSATNAALQADFQDCQVTESVESTNYTVTINGTVNTTASGSGGGDQNGLTSLEFNGTLSGQTTVSGDVSGTADLSNISYSGSGVPPAITCSGTASVTSGSTVQTCTISSDCSTCQQ